MAASVGEDPVSLTGPDGEPHDGCALSDWVDTGEISAEKGPGPWRKAKSLAKLKAQVDAAYPKRKGPDGFIGDKNHCPGAGWTGKSDHCLNIVVDGKGIVTAVDMRYEPENDCDIDVVVEAVRKSKDSRIKYIIWNRRICNPKPINGAKPWEWRTYPGAPHDKHAHFSVLGDAGAYDDDTEWVII